MKGLRIPQRGWRQAEADQRLKHQDPFSPHLGAPGVGFISGQASSCGSRAASESSRFPWSSQPGAPATRELPFPTVCDRSPGLSLQPCSDSALRQWQRWRFGGYVTDSPTVTRTFPKLKSSSDPRRKVKLPLTSTAHRIHTSTKNLTFSPTMQFDLMKKKKKQNKKNKMERN